MNLVRFAFIFKNFSLIKMEVAKQTALTSIKYAKDLSLHPSIDYRGTNKHHVHF